MRRTDTPTTLDEMTHCLAGPDLVAGYSAAGVSLYRFDRDGVTELGTFADARDAWMALDAVDAPAPAATVIALRDTSARPATAGPGFDSLAA